MHKGIEKITEEWLCVDETDRRSQEFISDLLSGSKIRKLTKEQYAFLDAALKQPLSLSKIQQEKRQFGFSQLQKSHKKLKFIRDYNRSFHEPHDIHNNDDKHNHKKTLAKKEKVKKLKPDIINSIEEEFLEYDHAKELPEAGDVDKKSNSPPNDVIPLDIAVKKFHVL